MSQVDLEKINAVINKPIEVFEQRVISTLPIAKPFPISNMLVRTTRFGRSILLTLYNESENEFFKSWLPKYIADQFSDNDVNSINHSSGKYTLTYIGQGGPVSAGTRTRTLVKFDFIE